MLFIYLDLRRWIGTAVSTMTLAIAAVLAPPLSIVLFWGKSCKSIACSKNHWAAARSSWGVSKKSTVSLSPRCHTSCRFQ